MKRYVLSVIAALFLLSGCAGHFCYRIEGANVHFYLRNPDRATVLFASSLDGYKFHEVKRVKKGLWQVTVPAEREFRYFYVINGEVFLPPCKLKEKDDFGSENCIYSPNM
ncbi:MAG: hypothetical protein U9R24_00995 [Thermodesulfobacteriota bacterium]|nr:hypothetical protein [Thermodesulfobacteriota bacterium]